MGFVPWCIRAITTAWCTIRTEVNSPTHQRYTSEAVFECGGPSHCFRVLQHGGLWLVATRREGQSCTDYLASPGSDTAGQHIRDVTPVVTTGCVLSKHRRRSFLAFWWHSRAFLNRHQRNGRAGRTGRTGRGKGSDTGLDDSRNKAPDGSHCSQR